MKKYVSTYGDLYTLDTFMLYCDSGVITDEDGSGYYSDGATYADEDRVLPSEFLRGNVKKDFPFIIWFNK